MPYGFYITDKGRELLTKSIADEGEVKVTKACFGSGGSPDTERDYAITELKSQFYEKEFVPGTDSYEIDPDDPTQICILSIVPSEVSGTINEIGFKDELDNLIIYGVVREKVKTAGSEAEGNQIEYRNWVKLENSDVDKLVINVQSPEFERIETLISSVRGEVQSVKNDVQSDKSDITDLKTRVGKLETTLDGVAEALERLI